MNPWRDVSKTQANKQHCFKHSATSVPYPQALAAQHVPLLQTDRQTDIYSSHQFASEGRHKRTQPNDVHFHQGIA
jgi:hypothetical protein